MASSSYLPSCASRIARANNSGRPWDDNAAANPRHDLRRLALRIGGTITGPATARICKAIKRTYRRPDAKPMTCNVSAPSEDGRIARLVVQEPHLINLELPRCKQLGRRPHADDRDPEIVQISRNAPLK
jgi:hypothetical protein